MNAKRADSVAGEDTDEAFLLRFLAACDAACPQCGYNLRALPSARCPECGEALRIGVGLVHPHLRGWLWLAVPLIASAGIGVFFLLLFAGRGSLPPQGRYPYFRAALVCFCLAIPLAAIVVWKRRSILKMHSKTQRSLAICAWVAAIIAMWMAFARGY